MTVEAKNAKASVPQATNVEKIFSASFAHPWIGIAPFALPPKHDLRRLRPRKFVGDYRSSKSSTISDRKVATSIISLGKRFEYLSNSDISGMS